MDSIYTILFVIQVIVAIALIGFVLIQHGKGADAGAAFGSGSSSTVFGSQGSGSFLTKVTTVLAILFLANSLMLAYLASERMQQEPTSLLDAPAVVEQSEVTTEVATPENDDGDQYEEQDQGIPDLPVE